MIRSLLDWKEPIPMEDSVIAALVLGEALSRLDGTQLYVVAGHFWAGLTDPELAAELTELRDRPYSGEQIRQIRRTAVARMQRAVTV